MGLTAKSIAFSSMQCSSAYHFSIAQKWEVLLSAYTGMHSTQWLNIDSMTQQRQQCLCADNKTSDVTVCVRQHSNEKIKSPSVGSEHASNAVIDQNII